MGVHESGTESSGSKPPPSVLLNGLRVLESFSIAEPVLGVTQIAQKVNLHKSSVSRILATLQRVGYVERDDTTGRFRLGLSLIALTGPLLANLNVRRVGQLELTELTSRTGETSALLVWNGDETVVVEEAPSPKQVRHAETVGMRHDTYQSASVQVFLSEMPQAEAKRILERRLHGPDDDQVIEAYFNELLNVRQRGYAINDGLTSIEEVGLAAPVRDHRGALAAAVLVAAPRFRAPDTMFQTLGRAVADAAERISARLGWCPPQPPVD